MCSIPGFMKKLHDTTSELGEPDGAFGGFHSARPTTNAGHSRALEPYAWPTPTDRWDTTYQEEIQ